MTVGRWWGEVTAPAVTVTGLVVLQLTVFSDAPPPFGQLEVLVIWVMYRTLRRGVAPALPWAAFGGLLLDGFAPRGFGVSAWSLVATALTLHLLGTALLTNRTLVSLVTLGIAGSGVAEMTRFASQWIYVQLGWSPWTVPVPAASRLVTRILFHVGVFVVVFWVRRQMSRRSRQLPHLTMAAG